MSRDKVVDNYNVLLNFLMRELERDHIAGCCIEYDGKSVPSGYVFMSSNTFMSNILFRIHARIFITNIVKHYRVNNETVDMFNSINVIHNEKLFRKLMKDVNDNNDERQKVSRLTGYVCGCISKYSDRYTIEHIVTGTVGDLDSQAIYVILPAELETEDLFTYYINDKIDSYARKIGLNNKSVEKFKSIIKVSMKNGGASYDA